MPVNTQHAQYKEFLDRWQRCRDVSAGGDAVHARREKYLPKLKDQTPDDYLNYLNRTPFYNATWRTIAGLIGMLFRKPPRVKTSTAVEGLLKNVDAAGQPFALFLQDAAENALTVGRVGVLVDYPTAPPGITRADAARLNLRPTMQLYRSEAIVNWKVDYVDNQTVLTQVVLKESREVQGEDEFTSHEEECYRVLDLQEGVYRQRVFKLAKGVAGSKAPAQFAQDGPAIIPTLGGKPLSFIPFVIMGTDGISAEVDDPPLIDLVDLNLAHYRVTADYEHGCHFTALPTLFLAGFTRDVDAAGNKREVYLGSEAAIITSNPNAKAEFIEFSGAGLASLERNLERKETQMAILGARMLEAPRKAVEAAETVSLHRKGEESSLASIAHAISLGMTLALRWFTEWAGADPATVEVELNRNYFTVPMTPQMLSALVSGWQQGVPGLSDQGIFAQLQAGEVVAEDVTLEEEQARIAIRQAELAAAQAQAFAAQQAAFGAGGTGGPAGGPGREEGAEA